MSSDFHTFPVIGARQANHHRLIVGPMQLFKSIWSSFKTEFGSFDSGLQRLHKQVILEIRLAADQAMSQEQNLQVIERKDAAQFRKIGRIFQGRVEKTTQEERAWRLQQHEMQSRSRKQKLLEKISSHDHLGPLKHHWHLAL